MSVLKLNQIQTASGVIMANLNSSGANVGIQLAPTLAPAFSAYRGTGGQQSVTSQTWTKVQLNTENFDTANCFDSTTNYRFTPTVAGYYQINGSLYFTGTSTVRAIVALYKNGNELTVGNYMGSYNSTQGVAVVSTLVYMNGSTDFLELYGFNHATSPTFVDNPALSMSGFLARSA
jgi:hypothetical protein